MFLKVNKQPCRVQRKNIRNSAQLDNKIYPSSAKGRGKAVKWKGFTDTTRRGEFSNMVEM
jgi:hypothetical protein